MTTEDAFKKLHSTIQLLGNVDDLAKAGKVLHELIHEFSLAKSWALLILEDGYHLRTDRFNYVINYLVIGNRAIRRRHNSALSCTRGIIFDISNNQMPLFFGG